MRKKPLILTNPVKGRLESLKKLTLLIWAIFLLFIFNLETNIKSAETQSNVSGSNTSIEGGYTGGATTYQSGSSSATTTNSTSNSNIRSCLLYTSPSPRD